MTCVTQLKTAPRLQKLAMFHVKQSEKKETGHPTRRQCPAPTTCRKRAPEEEEQGERAPQNRSATEGATEPSAQTASQPPPTRGLP